MIALADQDLVLIPGSKVGRGSQIDEGSQAASVPTQQGIFGVLRRAMPRVSFDSYSRLPDSRVEAVLPPDRVTVPTCIGCGAMGRFGTCAGGCGEQKLELVPAVQYDALAALASSARGRAEAFGTVVEELALREPGTEEWEPAYRSLQDIARIALRRYPEVDTEDVDWDEPFEFATTWWCAGCGGIDAPQPCLGICVWRSVEWVNRIRYLEERAGALVERDTEQHLRGLVRRVASVTPRAGQWERGWRALEAQAGETFRARKDGAEVE
jgi:hypothetical protein